MLAGGERSSQPTVATFVTEASLPASPGEVVVLADEAAHHARVRRLVVGAAIALRDGRGGVGSGRLAVLTKSRAEVILDTRAHVDVPAPVHLLVPIADRDRMLWLAEKVTEVGVASWRAVRWHRSRSVSPRGEGPDFARKVRARMASALGQCDGAWLPMVHDDAEPSAAAQDSPGVRLVLDPDGARFDAWEPAGEISLAIGPEGGFEPAELAMLDAAGYRRAALPGNILRFETAGAVGSAFARAVVDRHASRV